MSQHVLPARVRDVEPVSVQIELAHQRVAHVDDTDTIHDVRTRPGFSESLTGSGQFIDQRRTRGSSGSLPEASRTHRNVGSHRTDNVRNARIDDLLRKRQSRSPGRSRRRRRSSESVRRAPGCRLPGTRNLMVPMTTSHAPATIPRTTIELIGRGIYDHFGDRARRSRQGASHVRTIHCG
jgi:hypothetical protein